MHDLARIQDLCRQVEKLAKEHNALRVVRIVLEMGNSSHFTPEHMTETFLTFRGESPLLQEAKIEFHTSERLQEEELILRDVELEIAE